MRNLFARSEPGGIGGQPRLAAVMVPALIFAAALALRVWHITAECPWYDEIITLRYLNAPSLADFLASVRLENGAVPPLYLALEYGWARLAVPSETSLRLLSVAFGELTVVMTYLMGRRLFGHVAGCVAAAGLAVNASHVVYSQEIRMYALTTLLAAISAYTFLGLLR